MSKNDEKILTLKSEIERRRNEIGAAKRFAPETSCVIELFGCNFNINVLSKDNLVYLCCQIHALSMAAKDIGLEDQLVISGFPASSWESDIRQRLAIMDQKDRLNNLATLENKLSRLLSEDKKTELEINAIAAALK